MAYGPRHWLRMREHHLKIYNSREFFFVQSNLILFFLYLSVSPEFISKPVYKPMNFVFLFFLQVFGGLIKPF